MYFVGDDVILDAANSQVIMGSMEALTVTWSFNDVQEIHRRRFQLRDNALEIFLVNGKTFLLAMECTKDRDDVFDRFDRLHLPNRVATESVSELLAAWQSGQITNFDYLTRLNTAAGRSYNDLMQYPVFPFVLQDYESALLDLTHHGTFRDLSWPVAVQTERLRERYRDKYRILERTYSEMAAEQVDHATPPYHYASHYSNSGTVLYYLVRLPPFTSLFTQYQDSNFDLPDRTFHSILTSWRLSSYLSDSDVKELIPEFFTFPEISGKL